MKKNILKITIIGLTLFASLCACVGEFETINTNPHGIRPDQQDIGELYFKPMQALQYTSAANFQRAKSLNTDLYAGYMASCNNFGLCNSHYVMWDNWNERIFQAYANEVMKNITEILKATTEPDMVAVAKIVRVISAHGAADLYGAIPYTHYGEGGTSVPYDDLESLYTLFLEELKESVDLLTNFWDNNPATLRTRMASFDIINKGDIMLWIRFANSLRLRLAMHIAKVAPALAKTEAEAAVNHKYGVLTATDPDMLVSSSRVRNYLPWIVIDYNGNRMDAFMVSLMKGYADPRLGRYATRVGDYWSTAQAAWANGILDAGGNPVDGTGHVGEFIGMRQGLDPQHLEGPYFMYSAPKCNSAKPWSDVADNPTQHLSNKPQLMKVAEVYFLRAEGVLRGWNMGGTAKEFYEAGIKNSFDRWEIPDADYRTYIDNASGACENYVDPQHHEYDIAATDSETVKWDEGVSNERKLHKIINQKWLAMFPDGVEAWTEFRRTGYPKQFPVVNMLNADPKPAGAVFIKRLPFYHYDRDIYNVEEVKKATERLGGPDNIWTRLWWDVNEDNVDGGNF